MSADSDQQQAQPVARSGPDFGSLSFWGKISVLLSAGYLGLLAVAVLLSIALLAAALIS